MRANLHRGDRLHVVIYGSVNSGKSTLFNQLLGYHHTLTSDQEGTTTDVVSKAVELPGIGPIVLVDTPGMDDTSALGDQRMMATLRVMSKADIILYLLGEGELTDPTLAKRYPRASIIPIHSFRFNDTGGKTYICRVENVIEQLSTVVSKRANEERTLTGNLVNPGSLVVLVMPQDEAAPKGRLILPQVQTIRELLDKRCQVICVQPGELSIVLARLNVLPDLIITDSQMFLEVEQQTPDGVPLTSFSVLMSAYKGSLPEFVEGAKALQHLKHDARILIAEACSHIPTNEDIGRVKLPRLLRKKLGNGIEIINVNGDDFPSDLSNYDIVIHCGACMFNRQYVLNRQDNAAKEQVPMTNYGMAIAQLLGILDRIVLPI